jgi:hypothetical protein
MAVDHHEWYLEYQIHKNRPGLMGDISSLLGMLSINILTINGVENDRRGMLLRTEDEQKIETLRFILARVDSITITALRSPKLVDRMAIRHGRYLDRCEEERRTYRFIRDELGLLVDFMAELFKKQGHQLIGVRGMPRVGKTEAIVAASVCANKRWHFVSFILLKQTVRHHLPQEERSDDAIYLIDGIVSTMRSSESHDQLIRDILRIEATKVIEHPDVFVRGTPFRLTDFHYIIEIRHHPDEVITYEVLESEWDHSI